VGGGGPGLRGVGGHRPHPPQQPSLRALAQEHLPIPPHQHCLLSPQRRGLPGSSPRVRLRVPPGAGAAEAAHRTARAGGTAGRAEHGSELHQGLVEVSRIRFRQEPAQGPAQERPLLPRRPQAGQEARDHTLDVAVQCGLRLPERNTGDRARRVRSNARQRPQLLRRGRKLASVLADASRRAQEVPRATVVAQPLPGGEHLVLAGARQGTEVGKPAEEAFVVRDHRLGARLLQHDLRDQDPVRSRGAPPGQVPPVRPIPPK
jgi:hypothetical protein